MNDIACTVGGDLAYPAETCSKKRAVSIVLAVETMHSFSSCTMTVEMRCFRQGRLAGKADKKRQEREEACKQEPFICSRMLPFSKVSKRATAATKRAKRAIQVAEDPSGVNRGVKRRAERNEEILNWRKLKVSCHRS